MTRPFFSRDRITDFDNFERHADDVIEQMKDRLRAGHAIDFQVNLFRSLGFRFANHQSMNGQRYSQDAISRFTLDSASEFLLGHDVQSLSSGLPYPFNVTISSTAQSTGTEDFATAFAKAEHSISERTRIGWIWPLFEIFKDKTAEPMRVVNAFL